jgi:hypothetical protein
MDIGIIELSDDLEDSIDGADMREEFVPESFSLARSFDESCDIDELYICRYYFRTIDYSPDLLETRIIHIDYTHIRLDSTKGKIGCLGSI